MDKSKKLQIVTSLALINTFASPIWANVNNDLHNKTQVISADSSAQRNGSDASKNKVQIRSKHMVNLTKKANKTAYSTTHTTSTHE